jgi:DNA-binding winged helix-turn-helix (wHTH) protein
VTYSFGTYRIDVEARRISGADGVVHLTRKALDLLLLLLEHQPGVVSKDQIYGRVWPGTFVTESSLQSLVHELRQALDDRASSASWIRTVHGIGYSFCGPVVAGGRTDGAQRAQRPAAWLIGDAARVALHAGENIIGRELDDAIEIDAATISRRHARIVIGAAVTIEDLGSKNGTWLADERLTSPRPLADGSLVRLGSVTLTFRLAPVPRPTESVEEPPRRTGPTPG